MKLPRFAVLIALVLLGAACGGADKSAKASPAPRVANTEADAGTPFASLPEPGNTALSGFVGTDSAGVALAVALTPEGNAVAYSCDGVLTGTWFSGALADGQLQLTAKDGTKLQGKVDGSRVTGTLSTGPTFTLEPSTAASGVFRAHLEVDGKLFTAGWVVGNDGSVHGITTDEQGGKTATVAQGATGGGNASGDVPTPTTAAPVPLAFAAGLRCMVLDFRNGFNSQQFANAQPGSNAANDAREDSLRIDKKYSDLNCGARFGPAT